MKKWKPFITATCREKYSTFTAKVPVMIEDVVPEVPALIQVGKNFYTLTKTSPLTYDAVGSFRKAVKLK